MTQRTVYLNGTYLPETQAHVGIEDRGLQFGDAVYEVVLVVRGHLVDAQGHFERLARSMAKMAYAVTPDLAALATAAAALPARDGIEDGFVYIQVTRGAWGRNMSPASAPAGTAPTVIAYARPMHMPRRLGDMRALRIVSRPDRRWGHCDIKTTALAANMLARAEAQASGADDAWLVAADGTITEATAANAWIVRDGVLFTRAEGAEILGGITRLRVLQLAQELGVPVRVEPFRASDVAGAAEAFQTSATALVTPLAAFDGSAFPAHGPESVSARLFDAYLRFAGGSGSAHTSEAIAGAQ